MLRPLSMFGVMIALSVAALVPMASTAYAAQQQFFCVRAFRDPSGLHTATSGADLSAEQANELRNEDERWKCKPQPTGAQHPIFTCTILFGGSTITRPSIPPRWTRVCVQSDQIGGPEFAPPLA